MKRRTIDVSAYRGSPATGSKRRGSAAKEVVVSTFLLVSIGMTLYFLGQRSVVRLAHYVCTMTGAPYQ
jgi:hypothetical protein